MREIFSQTEHKTSNSHLTIITSFKFKFLVQFWRHISNFNFYMFYYFTFLCRRLTIVNYLTSSNYEFWLYISTFSSILLTASKLKNIEATMSFSNLQHVHLLCSVNFKPGYWLKLWLMYFFNKELMIRSELLWSPFVIRLSVRPSFHIFDYRANFNQTCHKSS